MSGHRRGEDALALIKQLGEQAKELLVRELVAPLVPRGRIRSRIGGVVYEFLPTKPFVGWGRFRPVSERKAEPLGEALPWEREQYLEQFPALRVILFWPDRRPWLWWGLPYNEQDARQRFGLPFEPLPVLLCDPSDGAELFERVLARVDRALWYGGPDAHANASHGERLRDADAQVAPGDMSGMAHSERHALTLAKVHRVDLANRAEEAKRSHVERELRHALKKADATLHSYREIPGSGTDAGHLVVEWSERGETYRYHSTIDRSLTVISSGICLSCKSRDDVSGICIIMLVSRQLA
jgi:hypothetical protein